MTLNRLFYPKTKIDWGPGENHICLKAENKNYYVVELFHQSPTFDQTIPLFISDLNSSPNLYGIYNYIADNLKHVILVNNHPINYVNVFGKIVHERYKEREINGAVESNVFLAIDDSSGSGSQIKVKLSQIQFKALGLMLNGRNYGKIVEIEGNLSSWCNPSDPKEVQDREIRATKITVLSFDPTRLHVEIDQWKKRLEFRKNNLINPWVFIPSPQRESRTIEYKFSERDLKRKEQREELVLSSESESMPMTVEEDSLLVHTLHRQERGVRELSPAPEYIEIISSSSSSRSSTPINEEPGSLDTVSSDHTDEPVQVVTEFQIITEIIRFIIDKNFQKFKLIEIYQDAKIARLLTNLTKIQLSSFQSSAKFRNLSFKDYERLLFHRMRHYLHKNVQLISVCKSQFVRLKSMKNLYNSLINILKSLKSSKNAPPFKVLEYLDLLHGKKLISEEINYKLINFMIDVIIEKRFNSKESWHYDPLSIAWSYIGRSGRRHHHHQQPPSTPTS